MQTTKGNCTASIARQGQQRLAVTLVGYGRYGKLIANKYMHGGNNISAAKQPCLVAVIDPTLGKDAAQTEDLELRTSKSVLAFGSFETWYADYWTKISPADQALVVVDVCVKPTICFNVVSQFAKNCGKTLNWMVLPKPVVHNKEQLRKLDEMLHAANIQTAVASQWAYSPLPQLIEEHLQQHAGDLKEIQMEFSKENGLSYETDPPLLELPHCIQLLHSTGMANFCDPRDPFHPTERHVTGTQDCVDIEYNFDNGLTIKVKCDVHYQPTPQERQLGANSTRTDYQIRTMKAFNQAGDAVLEADFWVHFHKTGAKVLREGFVKYNTGSTNGETGEMLVCPVREDQLGNMIEKIYSAIHTCAMTQNLGSFETNGDVLTLRKYRAAVAEEILSIEDAWNRHVETTEGFERRGKWTSARSSLMMRRVSNVLGLSEFDPENFLIRIGLRQEM